MKSRHTESRKSREKKKRAVSRGARATLIEKGKHSRGQARQRPCVQPRGYHTCEMQDPSEKSNGVIKRLEARNSV